MPALASFANIGIRILLIVSGAVVLGLSVDLANLWSGISYICSAIGGDNGSACFQYYVRSWPTSVKYDAFVGAFGLLAALVGLVPSILHNSVVVLAAGVLDILAAIFYLAGAINTTVVYDKRDPRLDGYLCQYTNDDQPVKYCDSWNTKTVADEAFLWIGFILSLFGLVTLFLIRRDK